MSRAAAALRNRAIRLRRSQRLVVPAARTESPAELMDRTRELALECAQKPLPLLRYARKALSIYERKSLLANTGLSHGLTLEKRDLPTRHGCGDE
jgi:hypothetical protein